jgi:hypothetical protein
MAAGFLLASLVLSACGGGGRAVEIDPKQQLVGNRWNAILATPSTLAGVTQVRGTGWMAQDEDDTERTLAFVTVSNAVPGGRHPWHVHVGQCGNDRGILGAADAYPILEVKGNGRAEATAELSLPVPTSGQYFINVHASPNNLGTIIACGNLAPPSR